MGQYPKSSEVQARSVVATAPIQTPLLLEMKSRTWKMGTKRKKLKVLLKGLFSKVYLWVCQDRLLISNSATIAAAGRKVYVCLFIFDVWEISLTEAHNLRALILAIHHTRFSDFNNEKSYFFFLLWSLYKSLYIFSILPEMYAKSCVFVLYKEISAFAFDCSRTSSGFGRI